MNHPEKIKRTIIVVLGMHRSGTSAITRGLKALGIELGDNLLEAIAGNNERGFWEDVDILDINMRLLASLGYEWDSIPAISDAIIRNAKLDDFLREATTTLENKFLATQYFGVKDPRLCILLPFWKRVFEALSLDVRYIISIRHPLAVATSLKRRDGFTIEKGLHLWHIYTTNAIAHTRNDLRVHVDYDLLLEDPEAQLKRMADVSGLPFPDKSSSTLDKYKNDFLTKTLNHFPDAMEPGQEENIFCISATLYAELIPLCRNTPNENTHTKAQKHNARLYANQLFSDLLQHKNTISGLEEQLRTSQSEIAALKHREARLKNQLDSARRETRAVRTEVNTILSSTSWRISAPLRLAKHLAKGNRREAAGMLLPTLKRAARRILAKTPIQYRAQAMQLMYAIARPVFPGLASPTRGRRALLSAASESMVRIGNLARPKILPDARIAIHIHLYYPEMANFFAQTLQKMPAKYDVFISTREGADTDAIQHCFSQCKMAELVDVRETPNIGRDIYPFVCIFADKLKQYDLIAHLHSKKSLYNNGATDGWLEYITESLFPSEDAIAKIIARLCDESFTGIVYPQNFHGLPYMANTWLANRQTAIRWHTRFGLEGIPTGYFDYPAGSMFWARSEALRPLFDAGITGNDFETESGQTDGTLAHCIERMVVLVTQRAGFNHTILADEIYPDWSAWRFGQFLDRTSSNTLEQVMSPDNAVVIFDIFDTLLTRPLIDPDAIKHLVAEHVDPQTAERFRNYRHLAEQQAREKLGRDVNIDDIYREFTLIGGLNESLSSQLQKLEESLEAASVSPRSDVVALFNSAVQSGKRVILASDMFLRQDTIERMLESCGVNGWTCIYLSNVSGLRKDSGMLYHHILETEAVSPAQCIMVGDNERSDFQIPCDMGMKFLHVLKPADIAHASPRFAKLLSSQANREPNIDRELLLGTLIRHNFGKVFYERFSPDDMFPPTAEAIGYSILGPLATCFAQWLADNACQQGSDGLYFLAREGEFLKEMYDLWREHTGIGPGSHYLTVSRRAVTVPTLRNIDDIISIAEQTFFQNTLQNFLLERFGITLSEEEIAEIHARGLWKNGACIEVMDKNVSDIRPLLQYLTPRILQGANAEAASLKTYLESTGILSAHNPYVVDVGYAASIQSALCKFTGKQIHGFYMLTNERAEQASLRNNVRIDACFASFIEEKSTEPALYSRSFELEKLLSAHSAQIIRYVLDEQGRVTPQFKRLSATEAASSDIREAIRNGARLFMRDHIEMRKNLRPNLRVPADTALEIYDLFTSHAGEEETEILKKLALDDDYCGRGVVA